MERTFVITKMFLISKPLLRTYVSILKLLIMVISIVVTLIILESMLNVYITMKLQSEYQHISGRGMQPEPYNPIQRQLQFENHFDVKREIRVQQNCSNSVKVEPDDVKSSMKAKARIKRYKPDTGYLLVLFTSFERVGVREVVHNNTKRNWMMLGKHIKTVLFTNDVSLQKEFKMAGWSVLPMQKVSRYGIPMIKYMYIAVRQKIKAAFYAFTNSDIIFTEGLVETLENIFWHDLPGHVYITGQRTDVWNVTKNEGSSFMKLKRAALRGKLHIPFAEDYFITDAKFPWDRIPELVIARQYYDNWMSFNARKNKYWTVDATETVLAVHQQVDRGSFRKEILADNNNRFYNYNLINKTMGREPNFEAGLTTCLDYYTARNILNETVIIKRLKPRDYCDVNSKRPKRIKHY